MAKRKKTVTSLEEIAESAKHALIGVLSSGIHNHRDIYDYLLDYLQFCDCIVSGIGGRPQAANSYMSIVDYGKVSDALKGFTAKSLDIMVETLTLVQFGMTDAILLSCIKSLPRVAAE